MMLLTGQAKQKAAFAAALTALLVLKHSGNIKRLLEGTERRVGEKT
jgi:glycerol-3-phosphate acyltransferase PlsY